MKGLKIYFYSFLIIFLAAAAGSFFTYSGVNGWYVEADKPSITPPNWFFPVIWTTLFILMAIALGRVWSKGWKKNSLGIVLFFIQLGLNVLWCALFFGFNLFLFGFIEIVFLWFAILATIIEFWQTDRKSAYLMFPYLAWVLIASVLNLMYCL